MKRTLLSLMLLVLAAVKMKGSKTGRHKRAFCDLLQLQEAASPSKFATWQWWSVCLIRWCVSPRACTPKTEPWVCSKPQRLSDNIISASASVCITSSLFSIFCLSHLTGIVGKQVEEFSQGADITRSLSYILGSGSMCSGGDMHCHWMTVGEV